MQRLNPTEPWLMIRHRTAMIEPLLTLRETALPGGLISQLSTLPISCVYLGLSLFQVFRTLFRPIAPLTRRMRVKLCRI